MKDLVRAGRTDACQKTCITVGTVTFGKDFPVIAGPCSVEDEAVVLATAHAVKDAGASLFRAGAFKPRTSPYAFQGLGLQGLKILRKVREETGLPIVTEVVDTRDAEWVCEYADVLQIGARNMQNFALLKEVGRLPRPVLLKRGLQATIQEWLLCAEYILSEGNPNVILCERGIRTFEPYTRNTFDLSSVLAAQHLTHLPVIADPSHGTGHAYMVPPMSLAACAAGADGLIIEVHVNPSEATSDKDQTISTVDFSRLMHQLGVLRASLKVPTSEGQCV